MSTSESRVVNGHTTRYSIPVSVVSQCKLVSGWELRKRRSAPPYGDGPCGSGRTLLLLFILQLNCWTASRPMSCWTSRSCHMSGLQVRCQQPSHQRTNNRRRHNVSNHEIHRRFCRDFAKPTTAQYTGWKLRRQKRSWNRSYCLWFIMIIIIYSGFDAFHA